MNFFQLINWEEELDQVQNKRRDVDEVRISSMDESIESPLIEFNSLSYRSIIDE